MPRTDRTIDVACLCGRFRFSSPVPQSSFPLTAAVCHCYGCRHISGALASIQFHWPGNYPDFSLLSRADFSPRVWTYFCPNCGSYVFWQMHQQYQRLVAPTAVLNESDDILFLNSHIWVMGSKDGGLADFLPIIAGRPLPRWASGAEAHPVDLSGLLPLGWKLNPETLFKETTLNAKCLCGGVEFKITRPSEGPPAADGFGDEWWLSTNNRFPAHLCVCRSCRVSAGTEAMPWAVVSAGHVKMADGSDIQADFGTLKWYRSSNTAMRSFCSGCGACVFYVHDDGLDNETPGVLNVAVGLFSASEGARADEWLCWKTWALSHEAEAANSNIAQALKEGLRNWGERNYEQNHPGRSEAAWTQLFSKLSPSAKSP